MRGEANSAFAKKIHISMAETGINCGPRRARVGGDSSSGSVADIGNTRFGSENSKQGNSTSCRNSPI